MTPTPKRPPGRATRRTPAGRADAAKLTAADLAAGRRFWLDHAPAGRQWLIDATPDGGKASARLTGLSTRNGATAAAQWCNNHGPSVQQSRPVGNNAIRFGHSINVGDSVAGLQQRTGGNATIRWAFPSPFAAVGEAPKRSGWAWLTDSRVFQNLRSGKELAADKLRSAVERVSEAGEAIAKKFARSLTNAKLSVGEWQSKMEDLIKWVHTATGLVGGGGSNAATDADLAALEAKVLHQFNFIENFAVEVEQDLALDGRIGPRAAQYLTAAVGTFEGVRRVGDIDAGMEYERRYLNSRIPCNSCQRYADMGWQEALVLPDIGEDCECTSRCLCTFVRRKTPPPGMPGHVVNPRR